MHLLALAILAAAQSESTDITSYLQPIRDISFTIRKVKANQSALSKISHDFGLSYKFDTSRVRAKEPFMFRLEASVDDSDVLLVTNGARKMVSVPRARLRSTEDLSTAPGKRQTLFDSGLLTPSLFRSLYDAKFVRKDRATGAMVFDVTYKANDTSRNRIWVDPQKKFIEKREWYGQDGVQKATFFYERPKEISGIWVPTRLTVKNTEDQVAGITDYTGISVNGGLDDGLFKI